MTKVLRVALWIVKALVFICLLGLAVKNTALVELHFYFGQRWQAPVAIVVLASFALGVLVGLGAFAAGRGKSRSSDGN